ncbi:hypothetical protein EC991_011034 [Linnemannia zychae]|nr:hypothetical protein EC991_011034 [Linnemannia zychae]
MSDDNPWRNGYGRNNTDGAGGGGNGWNGTRYGNDHRAQKGWWNNDRDGSSVYADSLVTYVVVTCYLSFLCFVALIMCFKNMTRLRVIAAIVTFLGLSIAVVGYLRANNNVLPNIYWAWNFFAEAIAVIALTIAIVSVGSGFYPMSGGRSIYARMSFVVIFLYAVVSIGTFAIYVQQRVVKHAISPEEVVKLRINIVESGVFDERELNQIIRFNVNRNIIPNNTDINGAADYMELSMPEQTFYMRPTLGFYLGHQISMLSTCVWVCMYLFIPLVKHHRHGPEGRPVDSDMMAIGVWYLTCLMSLAAAYAVLNIVYIFDNELIYKPQIQALDLCLRITIGPIFFLPAPKMLIRFYRNHFKKFRGNSANKNSSNDRWGSRWRKNGLGGNGGSGSSNTDSRTRYDSNNNPGGSNNAADGHALSRLDRGSGGGVDDAIEACANFDSSTGNHYRFDKNHSNMSTAMPTTTTPPPPAHKHLKLSRSRDRGLSVESSRVLTKDFDRRDSSLFCPSDQDTIHNNRPDSYYQQDYYNSSGMIMLDHRKDLTLDSLSPSPGPLPSPSHRHRHNSSDSSSGSGSGSGSGNGGREKRMTYGFDHPKPPKLALSPQQQQFLQSAPRSHMKRSDSSDSPSRLDFPSRSPIA